MTGSGKTVTRVDLCEAFYQKVGLSRTESATLVELVLKAQGRWEGLIASYVGEETPAVNAATHDDTR